MAKPPERWRPVIDEDSSEDDFRQLLAEELKSVYGDASNHLRQIEVRDIYKNITVEMLHDQEFVAAALKASLQLNGKAEELDAVRTRG
jgi:hypothetical protein